MFAVIHLPQFPLQAALRHEPELWAKPVALVDLAPGTPRVCAATDAARAAAAAEGLTPTQALARCRQIIIRRRAPSQESAATDAVLQCAFGYSPNIEHTSPGTVTLDLRALAELSERRSPGHREFDDADHAEQISALHNWGERLSTALTALNLRARIGIGPTPNVARHAAWWGRAELGTRNSELGIAVMPAATIVRDSPSFIASLPVAALEPSSDVALILRKWGVRTVGELLALGQDALAERIGLEALALFAAASATALRPLNLVRPTERYEESFDFEQEIETIEPLLFILRRFVDYLSQRLEPAGFVVERLTLKLRLESGAVVEQRLRLPQPTRRTDVLFRMLHTHLESLRTDSPIVSVSLKADPTQPEQKQFRLFEVALRDPHQFQETLARLSALVGADRVGTPVREESHRPDAFKLVTPDFEKASGVVGRKSAALSRIVPLRRFRPAVKAKIELMKPASDNPPPSSVRTSRIVESRRPIPVFRPEDVAEMLLFSKTADSARQKEPDDAKRNAKVVEFPAAHQGSKGLKTATGSADAAAEGRPNPGTPSGESSRPIAIQCSVAKGKLRIAVGPWRASGSWWDANSWQREEWDAATREGAVLRLVQRADGWFVEGVLD